MRSPSHRWAGVLLCGLLAAGCGRLGTLPRAVTVHDFGPPSDLSLHPVVPLRLIEVRAPSWLGSSAMHYRYAGERDQRPLVYTENRWAATPAELLEATLRRAMLGALPEGGGCALRVELDEFGQVFESAGSSHGALAARAVLVAPRADAVVAQQRFGLQVAAPNPNAAGGARALSEASRGLATAIDGWLATLDRARGGALNIADLCR